MITENEEMPSLKEMEDTLLADITGIVAKINDDSIKEIDWDLLNTFIKTGKIKK